MDKAHVLRTVRSVVADVAVALDGTPLVDVTSWSRPIDPRVLTTLGNPMLLCLGGHNGLPCALEAGSDHGVVLHLVGGRAADLDLAGRLRRRLGDAIPIDLFYRD